MSNKEALLYFFLTLGFIGGLKHVTITGKSISSSGLKYVLTLVELLTYSTQASLANRPVTINKDKRTIHSNIFHGTFDFKHEMKLFIHIFGSKKVSSFQICFETK